RSFGPNAPRKRELRMEQFEDRLLLSINPSGADDHVWNQTLARAIDRAADLGKYSEESLNAAESWVVGLSNGIPSAKVAGGLGADGYTWSGVTGGGLWSAALLLGATVVSIVLTPALLPWLPGRALAIKGAWVGGAFLAAVLGHAWYHVGSFGGALDGPINMAAWGLLIPAVASFFAMNFTGATTYTSLSGVRKEMALAVPLQACCALAGIVLWLVGQFV
ncbi:hypothetical protein LCGC14_3080320, partial [marine sediment metagenome]